MGGHCIFGRASCRHDVRLMPLAYVKPYVQKNDAADAEALRAEGGQSEIAHDVDPIGLAVVAAPAEFGIGGGAQAAGGTVEVLRSVVAQPGRRCKTFLEQRHQPLFPHTQPPARQ